MPQGQAVQLGDGSIVCAGYLYFGNLLMNSGSGPFLVLLGEILLPLREMLGKLNVYDAKCFFYSKFIVIF